MLTVGVDMAAEAANTAVAWVEWNGVDARVRQVQVHVEDAEIVAAVRKSAKAGLDCPLGWPDEFVAFLTAHRTGTFAAPRDVVGRDWRRRLAYRRTDEVVRALTGLIPLSVSADRIAHPAWRCAGVLAELAAAGEPTDLAGEGTIAEVYPAGCLKCWGLPYRGYKGAKNAAQRSRIVDLLLAAAAGRLDLGDAEAVCRGTDHALDAVLAALGARACALGLSTRPGPEDAEAARSEGWIALPTAPLTELFGEVSG